MHLASGTDTTASGAAIQQWVLHAAETEFALSVSVQVTFPGEETPAVGVDEPEPADASPESVDTKPTTASSLQPEVDTPPQAAAVPGENRQMAQPFENQSYGSSPSAFPKAEEASAPETSSYSEPSTKQRLDLLLDIELEATLRFGALELPLREVLELGPGDVLPLDRHVREPVELVVGDRIVAKGEVVLVAGNFALHVTEVAEPRRRLETIRCLF
jgi:flagellar motor switch protein FliN/FliY